jgi:cytochrome c-type biogenesis protein CcmE
MNKIQQRRLYYLCTFIVGIAIASGLIFYALRQNMNVFLTPAQLATMQVAPDYHIRLGGMVKEHSIIRGKQDLTTTFTVTDFKRDITVRYVGVLPDLFREGKGVIAEGTLNQDGIFTATQILAKHDENYMPKNVYEKMRNQQ